MLPLGALCCRDGSRWVMPRVCGDNEWETWCKERVWPCIPPPNLEGKEDAIAVSSSSKRLMSWVVGCPCIFVTVFAATAFRDSCSVMAIIDNFSKNALASKIVAFRFVNVFSRYY